MTEPAPGLPLDQVPESLAVAISNQLDGLDATQVAAVISTWNAVISGDKLGTVRRDPVMGFVGHRVSRNGVHLWSVTAPDGGHWADMQPSLSGWDLIYTPQDPEPDPADPVPTPDST